MGIIYIMLHVQTQLKVDFVHHHGGRSEDEVPELIIEDLR